MIRILPICMYYININVELSSNQLIQFMMISPLLKHIVLAYIFNMVTDGYHPFMFEFSIFWFTTNVSYKHTRTHTFNPFVNNW